MAQLAQSLYGSHLKINQEDSLARPFTWAQKRGRALGRTSVVCSQFGKLNTVRILTLFSLVFLNSGFQCHFFNP